MKRFIFYIIITILLISSWLYGYKRGYTFGLKDGKNYAAQQKHLAELGKDPKNLIPHDTTKPVVKVMMTNFDPQYPQELLQVAPIFEVIRERYNIEYVDRDPDILVNGHFEKVSTPTDPKIIKIFYTPEVYVGDPKKFLDTYDLVTGFDFIDEPNYIRIPFQYTALHNKVRHDYDRSQRCDPSSKKYFACFLVSNSGEWLKGKFDGAAARTRMFHKLSLYKKVASGGRHLNNVGGPAPDANEFLSQCKFTLAYENTLNYPGYVTEKPFNAWLAGSIPIYNTDPAGLVDINKKSIIYAGDFKTEEELVDYIIKIDNDDQLYCDIWNQKIVNDPNKDYDVLKDRIRVKLNAIFDRKLGKDAKTN